jgi:TorA maturation chaperone TorD
LSAEPTRPHRQRACVLYELTGAEAAAANAKDFETWNRLRVTQRCFLGEHLLRWTGRFFDTVVGEAEMALYRDFANLAKAFLDSEWDHLICSHPQGSAQMPFNRGRQI